VSRADKTIRFLTAPARKRVASKRTRAQGKTYADVIAIVDDVHYEGHRWRLGRMGTGFFVQLVYDEADVDTGKVEPQHGRKWYVSPHSTRSEIVQTMLLAAITSAEHRVREHFRYRNARVFMPHFSVDALARLSSAIGGKDVRAPKEKP